MTSCITLVLCAGRQVVTARAFLLLAMLLAGALPLPAATFREKLRPGNGTADRPRLDQVLEAFASLPNLRDSPFLSVDITWNYGAGSAQEGTRPSFDRRPGLSERVHAPHAVLMPDTPLWYEGVIDADEPTVLRISGDDGVQVFANGIPLRSFANELFRLPAGERQTLTLRVVNNAMHGGLNSVQRCSVVRYEAWAQAGWVRERLQHLVQKLALLQAPGADEIASATGVVFAAVRDPSEANLAAAENALARWPLFRVEPFLQEPADGQMTIVWETDGPGRATFEWQIVPPGTTAPSTQDVLPKTSALTSEDGLFEVTLKELPSDQVVFYRVRQNEMVSALYSFSTRAAKGDFRFAVWADSQGGWSTFARLTELMHATRPAFAVGVGDLVNVGSRQDQWLGFFAALHPLASSVPCFLVPGNHDYDGYYDDYEPVLFNRYARSAVPSSGRKNYFAWTWQNARFVALDLNGSFPVSVPEDSEQYQWLLREMDSDVWRQAHWRFVFVHQPCYSQGWPGYQGDSRIRDLLLRLADRADIDFVVSGHTHDYEHLRLQRAKGYTYQIIVGGAGGGLEGPASFASPVKMDRLIQQVHHFGLFHISERTAKFEMIDEEGNTRDSFTVTK